MAVPSMASSKPPRQRRRGRNPIRSNAANAKPESCSSFAEDAGLFVPVVETVKVLEAEEPPEICTCVGLREQVGGSFGVPCP
jgi:hypothetical protein